MKKPLLTILITLVIVGTTATAKSDQAYIGEWDSSINNLIEHPKTVALRIEVLDSETRIPIKNAQVLFKGTYLTEARTSRHPEGEQRAQEQEFKLVARTGMDGIVVAALGWGKEYPWQRGIDEIEKVQWIEVTHRGYRFVEQATSFRRFLHVGQGKFNEFEEAWAGEISKRNVKLFTFRSNNFSQLEFFKKIRKKEWGVVYKKPINLMQWKDKNLHLYGPYLVYVITIYMDKVEDSDRRRNQERYSYEKNIAPSSATSSPEKRMSWDEAASIIKQNIDAETIGELTIENKKGYETEIEWINKRRGGMICRIIVPRGDSRGRSVLYGDYPMEISYSGNNVIISHQDPEKQMNLITVTPVKNQRYQDDQYPSSINLPAFSSMGAKKIAEALNYLLVFPRD